MWYDLTQPFHEEMPGSQMLPTPEFETVYDVTEDGINVQRYCAPTHIGTHVDAPLHFVPDGDTIDEIPLDRFHGEGVVLDVEQDEAREIQLDDLRAAEGEVREDDIVVLYTGWCHRYGDDDYDPYPWLAPEVGEWLIERNVKMLCVDNISPDISYAIRPDDWDEYPIHKPLLREGILIAEHLTNLEPLLGERVDVRAYPTKIRGGDAAPARIVARPR